jgi:hemerythrin superfamily protein
MSNRIEEIEAKGKGSAKAMGARLHGLSGVFARLSGQHGEASSLLRQLADSQDADKRDGLWAKIRVELLSHERAEIRELYPLLRQYPTTRELAERHDAEAGEIERAIEKLDAADTAGSAWNRALEELSSLVQRHAEAEEKRVFPKAQEVLGRGVAKQLDDRYAAAQQAVKAELE